jgi:predicted nuclease of predicted toxin-antitoxin system
MDWMRQKGFETVILADVNLRGATDNKIAEFAVKNHMAVLTQDMDFGKLYYTLYRRELTVILVNTKEGTAHSIIQALDKARLKINLTSVQSKLLIVTEKRLRIIS